MNLNGRDIDEIIQNMATETERLMLPLEYLWGPVYRHSTGGQDTCEPLKLYDLQLQVHAWIFTRTG